VVAAAALVLGLGLLGCGGGSGGSTTSPAKAHFLQQANAVCARALQSLEAANQQAFGNQQGSTSDVAAFVEHTLVPNVQSQVNQLRALKPPPGDAATVNEILDTAQADVNTAKQDPSTLASNQPVFKDATRLASDYGLEACGSGNFF
jgi:hypothetical protein